MIGIQYAQAGQLSASDPPAVNKQKNEYMKMLDQQCEQSVKAIDLKVKSECEFLRSKAEQQKKSYVMNVDLETKKTEGYMTQKAEEEKMAIRQQVQTQKATLEQEAMRLCVEWENKKAQETMEKTQADMAKKSNEMQQKMNEDMQVYEDTLATSTDSDFFGN